MRGVSRLYSRKMSASTLYFLPLNAWLRTDCADITADILSASGFKIFQAYRPFLFICIDIANSPFRQLMRVRASILHLSPITHQLKAAPRNNPEIQTTYIANVDRAKVTSVDIVHLLSVLFLWIQRHTIGS